MSVMDKLRKQSKIKETAVLQDSKFFQEVDMVPTDVPMINVALSGSTEGGITPGLTVLAGPSKHFKTSFALLMAGAYLKEKKDAVMLFYDSEFGSPQSYFEQFGIPTDRVLHCPIKDVEQLKFDLINQLEALDAKDDVIIVIDSVGNLASKKELTMRSMRSQLQICHVRKAFKSLFRMTTPYLNMKKIPMIAINHTYKEIGLFPKDVVSGGTGIYYSADNIWIIGRRQNKTGTEVTGYDFVIKVDKSRYTKEQSKIPISVSWDGGVQKWSGLLDVALAGGYVVKPSNGWYSRNGEDKKFRQKETLEEDFWTPIFANTDFKDFLKKQFQIGLPSEVEFDIMVEGDA